MEQLLRQLFDFQRFWDHPALAAQIADTQSRYARELGDDDLSLVSAAGEAGAYGTRIAGQEGADGRHVP